MSREQPPPYSPPGQQPQYSAPGYQPPFTAPGQYPHDVTVVTTAPTMVVSPVVIGQTHMLGSLPTLVVCPSCASQIVTRVESSPSIRTHLIAALLCLFIFWPCTCMPYCIGSCNNADHYCPNCSAYIGSYKF